MELISWIAPILLAAAVAAVVAWLAVRRLHAHLRDELLRELIAQSQKSGSSQSQDDGAWLAIQQQMLTQSRTSGPSQALDDNAWIFMQEQMLALGRAFGAGLQQGWDASPVRGDDTLQDKQGKSFVPQTGASWSPAPTPLAEEMPPARPAPPREETDPVKVVAQKLYAGWCKYGQKPEAPSNVRIVPMSHELLPANGATGQPQHHFCDAQQMDAFVRFSGSDDTGWMFPHPNARHVPEYVRMVFPDLRNFDFSSRDGLARTTPVPIVRRGDHWELR